MSLPLRTSDRKNKGVPPDHYTPDQDKRQETSKSLKSKKKSEVNSKTSASIKSKVNNERNRLKIELKKLEEIAELERELERREFERKKKLIETRAAIDASVASSKLSTNRTVSGLSSIISEDPFDKVKQWLVSDVAITDAQDTALLKTELKREQTSHDVPNSSAQGRGVNDNIAGGNNEIADNVTAAMKALTETLKAMHKPGGVRGKKEDLPLFDGRPEEWPIFLAAFNRTNNIYNYTDDENLTRLLKCLKGEALEAVRPLFVASANVSKIIKTLETLFGKPEFIIETMINKAKLIQNIKEDDPNGLLKFSTIVQNFTTTAKSLNMQAYLTNPQLLTQLSSKLPPSHKYNWARYNFENNIVVPTLNEFSVWLEKEASIMSFYHRPPASTGKNIRHILANLEVPEITVKKVNTCVFCNGSHESDQCKVFRGKEINKRWLTVTELKLCFSCLQPHQIKTCKSRKLCGIKGCKKYHHRLLHNDNWFKTKPVDTFYNKIPSNTLANEKVNTVSEKITSKVLLKVCPVVLYGKDKEVFTYALLDDGSTTTLLDEEIAQELGLEGEREPLTTTWTNSSRHFESNSRKVDLRIRGVFEKNTYLLDEVRTMSQLDLPKQDVDTVKIKKKWTHLQKIDQPLPVADAKPRILIGQNHCDLILPRKIIEGPSNAPVLSWTKLGWTLHGKIKNISDRIDPEFTFTGFQHDQSLQDLVRQSFETEDYGICPRTSKRLLGSDRAIKILETTTKKVGSRYESGLLWKSDEFVYPESYTTAFYRLKNIETRMKKDPQFKDAYNNKIDEYLEKGYAKRLNDEEISKSSGRTYYLPHFGVTNPNKPGKLRLVFDAAAKANGVCFNDGLLRGPDLLNPLPAILLNFRQGNFAVVGDIQEMFHQVCIRREDQDAQRFLWRFGDTTKEPEVFVMQVMTFGATCSPCTALYVVNTNAKAFNDIYPEASKAILQKEYMDDLLYSFDDLENGMSRIQEIIEIHMAGGFKIVNWISNSKQTLDNLPEELKANSVRRLQPDSILPTERVLGIWWEAETDSFIFQPNENQLKKRVFEKQEFPTKREILKAAMSVFDPLGLVTPFTIKGRILVQCVWRAETDWDEIIPPELCTRWLDWLDELQGLQTLTIPRSYCYDLSKSEKIELHVFVDGSEEAFASVAYLRRESNQGIDTSLVMSRARVAPLKAITIPRMELQAAVMGCRMAQAICQDLEIKIDERKFWSDSKTVLYWIRQDSRTYKPFVAHRIGEIGELSKSEEWLWVPSKLNVADIATRSHPKFSSAMFDKWIHGPDFLLQPRSCWPEQPEFPASYDSVEKKRQHVGLVNEIADIFHLTKYSSWTKLNRVIAWVLRAVKIWKGRIPQRNKVSVAPTLQLNPLKLQDSKKPSLVPNDIKEAERLILQLIQDDSFREEKYLLSKGKLVKKTSRLYQLSPFLGSEGLIRVMGRTNYSPELTEDQRHPIILDGRNKTIRVLIQHYHKKCFHQGLETIIAELRRRYWIIGVRAAVKKVRTNCALCQLRFRKPVSPQMAPLPVERVTKPPHAFYYTGMDYFGPIDVVVGRRHEKRWGVIFTCLSTRAIHLEVAHSMNTESCVMAIQRFTSRRPCPVEIFSDNGTNLTAAEQELRKSVKSLDSTVIQSALNNVQQGITWHFIPPRSPHMGGAWERLIRSVKTALKVVLHNQPLKDEELVTYFTRIEFIVNCRPLTHLPVDPDDPKPLTPNDFLLEAFRSQIDEDLLTRRQLRKIKSLLDSFWFRWIREYVPTLTMRTKWHQKQEPPKIGDPVIIMEDNTPRNTWPLGRIVEVHPGKDQQIRVVDIQTAKGTFRRSLVKVIILQEEKDVKSISL